MAHFHSINTLAHHPLIPSAQSGINDVIMSSDSSSELQAKRYLTFLCNNSRNQQLIVYLEILPRDFCHNTAAVQGETRRSRRTNLIPPHSLCSAQWGSVSSREPSSGHPVLHNFVQIPM